MKDKLKKVKIQMIIVSIAMASILSSCGSTEKVPDVVLPKDKMVEVMADVQLAESYEKLVRKNGIKNPNLTDSLYGLIYMHHDITSNTLDTSLKYYSAQPYFVQMLDDVMVILEKKK